MTAPVLFYDGVCNLCNGTVRFVFRHERAPEFRFAALQSAQALRLVGPLGVRPDRLSSMLVLEDGRLYKESDAVVRVLMRLRAPWRWLAVLRWVPRPLRDAMYRLIGARRYRWWGRRDGDACALVDAVPGSRFLIDSQPTQPGGGRG